VVACSIVDQLAWHPLAARRYDIARNRLRGAYRSTRAHHRGMAVYWATHRRAL